MRIGELQGLKALFFDLSDVAAKGATYKASLSLSEFAGPSAGG